MLREENYPHCYQVGTINLAEKEGQDQEKFYHNNFGDIIYVVIIFK